MGFPIGDPLIIRSFLLADAQACQLFGNDLMATCMRSKETNSKFVGRIWSAEDFNFNRNLVEREVIWKSTIFN